MHHCAIGNILAKKGLDQLVGKQGTIFHLQVNILHEHKLRISCRNGPQVGFCVLPAGKMSGWLESGQQKDARAKLRMLDQKYNFFILNIMSAAARFQNEK